MDIELVPQIVIDNFLSGVPCAIGPFRCDQSHLYWQNKMIAFRKNGQVFKMDQPTATPPIRDPYQGSFVGALMITLPVVGLFFWFMYIIIGA